MSQEPCPYCAESVDLPAEKCPHCGEFLGERELVTPASNTKTILIVLAVVLFLGVGLCVAGGFMVRTRFMQQVGQASVTRAQIDLMAIDDAVSLYRLNIGAYPNSLADLSTDPNPAGGKWRGPYLKSPRVVDPWGNPYSYTLNTSGGYVLSSLGSDGVPGGTKTAADILARAP
jgi:general secretion pathway protein G